MDFERFSQKTVEQIERELKSLLEDWRREVGKIDRSLLPVVDKFIKANEGGKRIRGILVVLGYQLAAHLRGVKAHLGGDKDIFKIAAAYEIFHTAILAHDDIMDQDPIRRDKPSLYMALGGDHTGVSLAICLADAGFFLATRIISESQHLGGDATVKALRWFSQIMLDTTLGQILEMEKGESLAVARYKTAKYSVAGPLVLGGILAKAHLPGVKAHLEDDLLKNLAQFGENLGIAFQIRDDILDSEIRSVERGEKEIAEFKNRAMKVLPRITKDKKMSKLLQQMAEYLIERKK